jgi:hypothetical protein
MSSLTEQPENLNFLSPISFRFVVDKLPNVNYYCKSSSLPSVAIAEGVTPTPFINLPFVGTKLDYGPLDIRFTVDEDMKNYLEIYDWMLGLGAPENFNQYKDLNNNDTRPTSGVSNIGKGVQGVYSDGSLVINTSSQNPNMRISFVDLYPINLSPLQFDVGLSDITYLEADVSFRYRQFKVAQI